MKKVKANKLGRRILSIVMTVALVVGLMPGNMLTVKAEEIPSKPLSVTAFATPEQLMSSDNFYEISDQSQNQTNDSVYQISEIFERDSRRYNRAFTEQQEVSAK